MSSDTVGTSTGPVRAAHGFDSAALTAYLEKHVDGFRGPIQVRQFSFGQSNPTFLLIAPSGKYVMRKKPPGKLMSKTAHAVEREYKVLNALQGSAVPVPRVHVLCTDSSVVGTPFFIMEYVQGRIFTAPSMPDMSRDDREACMASVISVLQAIHSVDIDAVGLGDFGRRGGFYERQVRTMTRVSSAQVKVAKDAILAKHAKGENKEIEEDAIDIPRFAEMRDWFATHLPKDRISLVHGDYKVDNLIFHPTEPRVIAVLDWELSTIGHPMADVANLCLMYHLPSTGLPMKGVSDLDLEELNFPTQNELIKRYYSGCGIAYPDPQWNFYMAMHFFKYTVIFQGVATRALKGVASSGSALRDVNRGRMATQMLVDMAIDLINSCPMTSSKL